MGSDQYSSTLKKDAVDQKKRDDDYEATVAKQNDQNAQTPALATKEPTTFTKAEVDKLLADTKAENDRHTSELKNEWAAKKASEVAHAVEQEKQRARTVIKAAEERSTKQAD